MGQFSVTIYGATGSVLSDIQQPLGMGAPKRNVEKPDRVLAVLTLAGATLVRLRAAPLGFSRCVFSASPMLVQCHQEMVPDNLRGKYNEQ